ncbi:hypothetical protein BU15DRAFT_83831 [Melanogaster broomeanus]|nr:hypothetical protein BU15DRAFT_83831 [Melanogaster broomeanus]
MPKRARSVRSALQNLGNRAKKVQGMSNRPGTPDKENLNPPACHSCEETLGPALRAPAHTDTALLVSPVTRVLTLPSLSPIINHMNQLPNSTSSMESTHARTPANDWETNCVSPNFREELDKPRGWGSSSWDVEADSLEISNPDDDDDEYNGPLASGGSPSTANEGFENFEAHARDVAVPPPSSSGQAHVEDPTTAMPHTDPHIVLDFRRPPSVDDVRLAIKDVQALLHPPRSTGYGFKLTRLTSSLEKRLTWMQYFLRAFAGGSSWSSAALKTAQFVGKGPYVSRKVREWSKAYIADREDLPLLKYGGAWTKSRH